MSLELTASPEQLKESFFLLENPQDVAALLDIKYEHLNYHLYISDPSQRYSHFSIPKPSGANREISAPATALKILQRKLTQILSSIYESKPCVHGFVAQRSIVTNARKHTKKRYVLNLDLKEFFPSINFGRVRGMFMAWPYSRNSSVATILAQICCYDNQLPQGAPTSPIISNMICAKMDSQLMRLAEEQKCIYSRYADDLTFSTSLPVFPSALATMNSSGQVDIGTDLKRVIGKNGFEINERKVRLQPRYRRQEVTGIVTNRFTNVNRRYVRQIRAMLHAWKKFGLESAEREFFARYDHEYRGPYKSQPSFKRVVKGRIDFLHMVKGKDDPVYITFLKQYAELDPTFTLKTDPSVKSGLSLGSPLVFTEGKTDWQHLENALSKLKALGHYRNLQIEWYKREDERGDQNLLRMCNNYCQVWKPRPHIFVFDKDNPDILKEIIDKTAQLPYKNWSNNVFSIAIPVPEHRNDSPSISIELYYSDEEIRRKDEHGRRLFLNNEFKAKSGRHTTDPSLSCADLKKVRRPGVCIVDTDVYNDNEKNVALPKSDFADYILSRAANFSDFNVLPFTAIFDIIQAIADLSQQSRV